MYFFSFNSVYWQDPEFIGSTRPVNRFSIDWFIRETCSVWIPEHCSSFTFDWKKKKKEGEEEEEVEIEISCWVQ